MINYTNWGGMAEWNGSFPNVCLEVVNARYYKFGL